MIAIVIGFVFCAVGFFARHFFDKKGDFRLAELSWSLCEVIAFFSILIGIINMYSY